jgi:hypothetical protein
MISFDFEDNFKALNPSIEMIRTQFELYKKWELKMNSNIEAMFN